jgi:hypothetical protein
MLNFVHSSTKLMDIAARSIDCRTGKRADPGCMGGPFCVQAAYCGIFPQYALGAHYRRAPFLSLTPAPLLPESAIRATLA